MRILSGVFAAAAMLAFAHGDVLAQQPAPPTPPIVAARDIPYPGVIDLHVDVSDVQRGIYQINETIPVSAGRVTLLFPEWIPGTHAPEGDISKLAGLTITANGRPLTWVRDAVYVYAFHVDVPQGVHALNVHFQFLSATADAQGQIYETSQVVELEWHSVLLYPAGYYAARINVTPSITIPAGWHFASALDGARTSGAITHFAPVDLVNLVDSPVYAGQNFRRIDLDQGHRRPFFLNLFGHRADQVNPTEEQVGFYRNMVVQADRLFGARHFDHFDILFALDDDIGYSGMEHHRSSENGLDADYFTDWDRFMTQRFLLPHEFVHSWDGKYRRPAEQWIPDYNTPMRNSLLWMYEGGTDYWGAVLTARSGLWTTQQALDEIAIGAAVYDNMAGRNWRPLQDTTHDGILFHRGPQGWHNYQRAEDYYGEGDLIWLDADTLIRERTNDQKSLDDFARDFFGGHDGEWTPVTYTFDDVVASLNRVLPYDWATFLRTRLDSLNPHAPLDGLTRGGYRLVYTDEPSAFQRGQTRGGGAGGNFAYSLGITVGRGGNVGSVAWDSPSFNAGMTVSTQIIAVNGIAYDNDVLARAITAAKTSRAPIQLIIKNGDRVRAVSLDYHGGLRYPHLERIPGTPDRLSAILAPRPS